MIEEKEKETGAKGNFLPFQFWIARHCPRKLKFHSKLCGAFDFTIPNPLLKINSFFYFRLQSIVSSGACGVGTLFYTKKERASLRYKIRSIVREITSEHKTVRAIPVIGQHIAHTALSHSQPVTGPKTLKRTT